MIFQENMVKFWIWFWKKDLQIFLLLIFFIPLFFYKLGQSSLVSWDEAWYAGISHNILKSGDLFNLIWNGEPFSDKPPGQFWIEALTFKLLGVSDFTARLPSAVVGILSVFLVYLIGKNFSRVAGLMSALALGSSVWFLYRARSGNLDAMLTFFFLLTFYLGMLVVKNSKFLLPFAFSFAYLSMIKGIIFLPSLIPSLTLIFWGKLKLKDYLIIVATLFGFFGIWILIQFLHSPALGWYHFSHSLRDSSLNSDVMSNLKLFKEYVHNGIGRWFWPGVLGVMVGLVLKNKKLLVISLFPVIYSLQFMFSPEIQIWQLIPLYPFMILSFFGSIFIVSKKVPQYQILINTLVVIFTLYVSLTQIRQMWFQFIDIPAFVSDDAILSRESKKFPQDILYIDGDFVPTAIFYSEKKVSQTWFGGLPELFDRNEQILLITKQERLDGSKIPKSSYEVIKQDRDRILIKSLE